MCGALCGRNSKSASLSFCFLESRVQKKIQPPLPLSLYEFNLRKVCNLNRKEMNIAASKESYFGLRSILWKQIMKVIRTDQEMACFSEHVKSSISHFPITLYLYAYSLRCGGCIESTYS